MLGHDYESVVESVSFIARDHHYWEILLFFNALHCSDILDTWYNWETWDTGYISSRYLIYPRYIRYLRNLGYLRYLRYLIWGSQIGSNGAKGCYRGLKRLNGHHLSQVPCRPYGGNRESIGGNHSQYGAIWGHLWLKVSIESHRDPSEFIWISK